MHSQDGPFLSMGRGTDWREQYEVLYTIQHLHRPVLLAFAGGDGDLRCQATILECTFKNFESEFNNKAD
jgi:hypothetical protein